MGLTQSQIERFRKSGRIDSDLGLKIHHDYQVGRITLVDSATHDRFAHVGGNYIW